MNDLKLIDELLVELRSARKTTFAKLERESSVVRDAMDRLRQACADGEATIVTLSVAKYLDSTMEPRGVTP